MCVQALPLLLSAAGTAVQYAGQRDAQQRADRAAAEGIMKQAEFARQAQEKIGENIRTVTKSSPKEEQQTAQNDFLTALRRSKSGAALGRRPGAVSGRFSEDEETAQAALGGEGATLANQLSRIDAPGYQRIREGQGAADLASRLSLVSNAAQGQDFLARLRAGSAQANPIGAGVGQALQAYGQASAGRLPPGGGALPRRRLFFPGSQTVTETPIGTTTLFGD